MPRIELNDLTANCANDPERINLLRWFYSQFDYSVPGFNRHIENVEPLYFMGALAGTEFLVYAATKLYLIYTIVFCANTVVATAANIQVTFYNEANAIFLYSTNTSYSMSYTSADVQVNQHSNPNLTIKNLYFARIITGLGYNNIIFNGYRITLG